MATPTIMAASLGAVSEINNSSVSWSEDQCMNVSKKKLVPALFALTSVLCVVPAVIRFIKGEPLNGAAITFLCAAGVFLCVAAVVGRKSGDGSGPPSA